MTSRERVKRAIHFEGPDRIPHYLPDGKDNDILWLWPTPPPDIMPWHDVGERQRRVDDWGAVWETTGGGSFGETVEWPVADLTTQASYTFPGKNASQCLAAVEEAAQANNASGNPKYCLAVMPFASLNENTHSIMGLENMFVAYFEQPDHLKALIGRFAEAQRESICLLGAMGCDGVMGYDDWGLQDRLMVSMDLFEEFFLPHYRQNWQLAHDLGMDVWLHSCGCIIDLLLNLIDAGLNVIQMDQQENMGLENLDARVGGRLAFWCPVDIQKTMIEGSLEDIRRYVKRMMRTVGSHNGGLISMAYSMPEAVGHTPERMAVMCEEFRITDASVLTR